MKKTVNFILILISFIFLIGMIDLINIFFNNDYVNQNYKGLIFNSYYCQEYPINQIKFKWNKYSCQLNEETINKEKSIRMASLTLVGDLLFEQPFYDAIDDGYDTKEYFSLVKNYFEEDDLSIGNMEVVIGNNNLTPSGVGYNFCAPEYIGSLVGTIDFEVLGTANNHSFDRGIEGINSTIDFFKNNTDILTVGTYKNNEDRENFRILNINNINFGFLAYTYGTNQKVDESNIDMIGYYRDPFTKTITDEYKNKLTEEINKIKEKSDIVIVLMHWGLEFTYNETNEQKEMAEFLNSLGVDIIIGSHSHNIQPIEIIGEKHKTLVYYSLGNFVSADDDIARTKLGQETFDNAYQVGLLSKLNVVIEDDKLDFQDIETELIVNYFDKDMHNFKLIPFKEYSNEFEKNHYRYELGLTKEFINNMYENVINKDYRN